MTRALQRMKHTGLHRWERRIYLAAITTTLLLALEHLLSTGRL